MAAGFIIGAGNKRGEDMIKPKGWKSVYHRMKKEYYDELRKRGIPAKTAAKRAATLANIQVNSKGMKKIKL